MTTSSDPMPASEPQRKSGLQPDWERIADGLPWRLEQGRDFEGSPKRLRSEAKMAARDMEKSVSFVRDRVDPNRFVWLQFADAHLVLGQPCPRCGGDQLLQLSGQFARCATCRAVLIVERPPDVEDVELQMREAAHAAGQPDETLAAYHDAHLSLAEADASHERFIGYAFDDDGRFHLLYVVAPLAGGRRIPDESSPTGFLHTVTLALEDPFGNIVDVSGLLDTQLDGWDIAVQ
jgi:hypothetical protein